MKKLLHETTAYNNLRADAERGAIAHTTLVVFPDESYLRPLLIECAKAFFGAKEGSREAKLIETETYSDCLFFPAAGGKLTTDDGARIVEESLLRPVEGDKKLFVLDAFHNVTPLMQNKLLKLLEEPPEGVHFLIGTVNEHAVLPTVLSRARKLVEPPFPEEKIEAALKRMHGDGAENARAAAASGGVLSLAETLLEGSESFAYAEEFLKDEDGERLCREMEGKADKAAFFAAVRLILRDMLFYKIGAERYVAIKGESVQRLSQGYPAGALVSAIGFVSDAERNVRFNANFSQAALALLYAIREEKDKWKSLS